ncbi:MAG: NIPSNAP family protein [Chitinophagaceae bacterium]|nr:NIPSNAP family protein [Polaromonas sp.]
MIYEMRTYDVKPGLLAAYLKLFNDVGMPERKPYNNLVGFWFTEFGPLNQVIHIWKWDSLDQRTLLRAELMQNPKWTNNFLPLAMPMLNKMTSVILNPAQFSPLQ